MVLRSSGPSSVSAVVRHRINAGRVAIRRQVDFFRKQFGCIRTDRKNDGSWVTFADFAISERLFHALRGDFPDDVFFGEEGEPGDAVIPLDASFAWVLDPIDGTENYALGFPCCGISLALLRGGRVIYGFVYDHTTGRLFEGGAEFGLWVDQRRVLPTADVEERRSPVVGLHFPIPVERVDQLRELLAGWRVRSFGSIAVSLVLVAKGYLDALFDESGKLWDVAAGIALVEGAGRTVYYPDGSPFPVKRLHVNTHPVSILVGDAAVCASIRDALSEKTGH